MTVGKFQTTKQGDPVSVLANALSRTAFELAAKMRMSKMDVCCAFANAIGHILADSAKSQSGGKSLPRDGAISRMDDLREVMQAAYDLRDVAGES